VDYRNVMASDTRDRMLEATARLLQQRGYHGASLNDILAASGAPRGSLYFHFPGGKDQLVIEATRATVDRITADLREALAGTPDPARAVRGFFAATAEAVQASNYAFGCPVAPVILDSTADVPELAALCRNALDGWIGMLSGAFTKAGIAPKRAQALALLAQSTIEGLLLIARARRDCGAFAEVSKEIEAVVAAAMPKRKTRRRD
jgi:TetR/AcrR family transcriptional regulator, lmrAB and yxaGH operons repressor